MQIDITRLGTRRLSLDPLALTDIPAIYEIARHKESIEDFQHVARSVEDVRKWLEPSYHDPEALTWIIRCKGQVIGMLEAELGPEYSEHKTNVCRIGYFMDHREQNKGYATEALRCVIDWLFSSTPIERIEAGVTTHNVPSYRILEKTGFVHEKTVKGNWEWDGQVYDSAYYYLIKPPVPPDKP